MATFYGYLHSWIGDSAGEGGNAEAGLEHALSSGSEFGSYVGSILPATGRWTRHLYHSPKPLMGEEEGSLLRGGYSYPFYLYVNKFTGNIIIGSYRYSITNMIVENINFRLARALIRNSIDVQRVVDFVMRGLLLHRDKKLFVSQLTLDVHDYGSGVQSMTLHGLDIAGSGYLETLGKMRSTARQIGLMMPGANVETTRLQNGGGIQFYSDRLLGLERILGVVQRIGGFSPNL